MWKKTIKKAGLAALQASGAFSVAVNSSYRRNRLLILCYHGISLLDEHLWEGNLYITAERFRQRLALLRSFDINVLPLSEALRRLREQSLPPRAAVITFDDGFYDFLVHAVPVVNDFQYPCTLYLTTHYCYHPFPIFNLAVEYVLWKSGKSFVELDKLDIGLTGEMPVSSRDQRYAVKGLLLQRCAALDLTTAAKNEVVHQLAESVGVDYGALVKSRLLQIITPEEAAQTARAGIDIQLHTHRHRTPRNRDLFIREIRDNAASIQDFTGRAPTHFCYPSGDYAMEFLPWLRECGVESATTCVSGMAKSGSDPLLLPRKLDDTYVGELNFKSFLSGLPW